MIDPQNYTPQEFGLLQTKHKKTTQFRNGSIGVTAFIFLVFMASEMVFVALVLSAMGGFLIYYLQTKIKNLTLDLSETKLIIIQGRVEKKTSETYIADFGDFLLTVGEIELNVTKKQYDSIQKEDEISLRQTAHSKIITSIQFLHVPPQSQKIEAMFGQSQQNHQPHPTPVLNHCPSCDIDLTVAKCPLCGWEKEEPHPEWESEDTIP
jgi:hypothetical protein